jgi:uncharacterized protein
MAGTVSAARVPPLSPAFRLRSTAPEAEYWIFEDVPAEAGPWPAVLFLDGDDQFRLAVAAYRALRAGAEVPPLLLIGVGYGASYTQPANRRLRDYTPTAVATEPASGGAGDFVAFLRGAFWRELGRRHPLREDVRGIAGHSLGSLAALHALFQAQPFFNRVLASAPSLWWDDRSLLGRLDRLPRDPAAAPSRLFLAVGDQDTPSMTGDLRLLEDRLRDRPLPQLEVISRRFAGRDHYNLLPDAFREGLRRLFT